MKAAEVAKLPTELPLQQLEPSAYHGDYMMFRFPPDMVVREDQFRAYHILEKVKGFLGKRTPHDVILGLIGDMEAGA